MNGVALVLLLALGAVAVVRVLRRIALWWEKFMWYQDFNIPMPQGPDSPTYGHHIVAAATLLRSTARAVIASGHSLIARLTHSG